MFVSNDFSGNLNSELWYFECKRYSSSLDWPLVHQKVSYADANGADFLLLITNSNPSAACETQISKWNNNKRRPQIRTWRGYELEELASRYPAVSAKYGLRPPPQATVGEFVDLALVISKISQAAYLSLEFGSDPSSAVEAAAALSELFSFRCENMAEHGMFIPINDDSAPETYEWHINEAPNLRINLSTRALLAYFKFTTGAKQVKTSEAGGRVEAVAIEPRLKLQNSSVSVIAKMGIWGDLEILMTPPKTISFLQRH